MSTKRWNHGGIQIDTYAGPLDDCQCDRRHVQVTNATGHIQMSMSQWHELVHAVAILGDNIHQYEWVDREYDSGVVRNGIMTCIELRGKPLPATPGQCSDKTHTDKLSTCHHCNRVVCSSHCWTYDCGPHCAVCRSQCPTALRARP